MVRHSNQDALSEQEFERLVDATQQLDEPFQSECYFVLFAGGRLGLRAGEISHIRESWIDWERQQIRIPRHEPCSCGYCKQQAQQAVEHNPDLTFEDAMAERWQPKTWNSARPVPFDFNPEIEAVVRTFFDEYDAYEHSRASVNRRVDRVLEAAGLPTDYCYPHALRATAATWHAYRGLPAAPLQALMGWAKISTAEKYIRLSGEATAEALRDAHQD